MSPEPDHVYTTPTEQLRASRRDGVATLTFDNPAKHNALTRAMQLALPEVLDALRTDPAVRLLVLRGAGDRAFVSEADISEFRRHRTAEEDRAEFDRARAASGRAWAAFDKPIIAMIRGYCIGGGLLTALAADIRICTDASQFGVPAARLGLGYPMSGVEALVAVVGRAWAAEILFSGRRLNAAEALHVGLVNRIVPDDRIETEVAELAGQIAANAPLTVAAVKASLQELRKPGAERDHERVASLVEACFRSDDYREGQAAFAERRARFEGR